ncbi:hypothetical protein ACFLT0_01040 [Chloroflexota bacterium]
MKVLKTLALSLLSFLLFLSLSVLGLAFTLNSTILNPDFIVGELDKLDMYSLAREWLGEQISEFEVDARYQPYVDRVLNDTLADLEPWLERETNGAVHTGYDYFLGRSERLSLVISTEPVRDSLKQNLRETVFDSPPPELQGLPPSVIEPYLNEAYRQIDQQIPPTLEFDQATLDPEAVASLEQTRQVIGYFQLGFKLLIGFILLLILSIVMIYREIRGATRGLGITFLICGVITYLGNLAVKYFAGARITQIAMPVEYRALLPRLLVDILVPLDIYSIVLAAIGVALIIVSFVYKPHQSSF